MSIALDREQIMEILPHRPPMLLIDRVIECEVNQRAVAELDAYEGREFFEGHFPGKPVMPGVMMIEAMAQAGAVAVLSDPAMKGRLAIMAGASNVKFRRQVVPGDVVRLEVELTHVSKRGGRGRGLATVDGQKCCEGELSFVFG